MASQFGPPTNWITAASPDGISLGHLTNLPDPLSSLLDEMSPFCRSIVEGIGTRIPSREMHEFSDLVEALIPGISPWEKCRTFEALARVPNEQISEFKKAMNNLIPEVDSAYKSTFIEVLANTKFWHVTRDFVRYFKSLTDGMENYEKTETLKALAQVPSELFRDIKKQLSGKILQIIKTETSSFKRKWLIIDLCGENRRDQQKRLIEAAIPQPDLVEEASALDEATAMPIEERAFKLQKLRRILKFVK